MSARGGGGQRRTPSSGRPAGGVRDPVGAHAAVNELSSSLPPSPLPLSRPADYFTAPDNVAVAATAYSMWPAAAASLVSGPATERRRLFCRCRGWGRAVYGVARRNYALLRSPSPLQDGVEVRSAIAASGNVLVRGVRRARMTERLRGRRWGPRLSLS